MTTGNHNADQADKARDKADKCECGSYWREVDWCTIDDEPCYKECEANIPGMPCYKAETRFVCKTCGAIRR